MSRDIRFIKEIAERLVGFREEQKKLIMDLLDEAFRTGIAAERYNQEILDKIKKEENAKLGVGK